MAQKVQRRAFGGEEGGRRSADMSDHSSGLDHGGVRNSRLKSHFGIDEFKGAACHIEARDHARFARREQRRCPAIWRDSGLGGYVAAAPEIFDQGGANNGFKKEGL